MSKRIFSLIVALILILHSSWYFDYQFGTLLLVFIIGCMLFVYGDFRVSGLALIGYLIWFYFYYSLIPADMYYTDEQVLTDSNFYDYHALRLSVYDIPYIYDRSEVTWQSTGVIFIYALVYKIFGDALINPIMVNFIMIFSVLKLIRVSSLNRFQFGIFLLLFPFFAINTMVVGKDALTVFLLSAFLGWGIRNQLYASIIGFSRSIVLMLISFWIRFNSIPFFFFPLLALKSSYRFRWIFLAGLGGVFMSQFILEHYSDISIFIQLQRDISGGGFLIDVLIPNNIGLFLLVSPLRIIAFLISPFPMFSVLFDGDGFHYIFTFFKFLSGFAWFVVVARLIFTYRYSVTVWRIYMPVIFCAALISTVHLIEGGRYRVVCDLFLVYSFILLNRIKAA